MPKVKLKQRDPKGTKKLTEKRRKREQSVEDLTPLKKSFVEALSGLMSKYTEKTQPEQPKNRQAQKEG